MNRSNNDKKNKGYIVKRAILVTIDTYDQFTEDVKRITFKGKDKRKSPPFYKDISRFLMHLICNCYLYTKERGDDDFTKYVPIPSKLGKDKLPHVFKQSKYLGYDRALELLKQKGIIKIKSYNYNNHKCRQFALSKEYLNKWFDDNKKSYMNKQDRFLRLDTPKTCIDSNILTEDKLKQLICKNSINKTRHVTRHISRNASNYMKDVYHAMGTLHINIDNLFKFKPKNSFECVQKSAFIQHLIDRGCDVINKNPLIIGYKPEYKVANVGTRSFEINKGFQFLKSSLKWYVFVGYNYDIKSSQLMILKHELKENNIKCKRLKNITKKEVMERFNVSDKVAKMLIYSLIFSVGHVNLTNESKVFKKLSKYYSTEEVVELLKKWEKYVRSIKESLNQLVDSYIYKANKRVDRGISIKNAVGNTYLIKSSKITTKNRRRILTHIIQGIESKAIYDTILSNPHVCGSIEHDGVVSSEPIKWVHPYLKLKLKHTKSK